MKDMVSSDVAILRGKPVIAGTRIAVETILDLLAAGLTSDEVVKEYPGLTVESVRGADCFCFRTSEEGDGVSGGGKKMERFFFPRYEISHR